MFLHDITDPRPVHRDSLLDWVGSLGLDASNACSMTITPEEVTVIMYALDGSGKRYMVSGPSGCCDVAKYAVHIPVVPPMETAPDGE